VKLTPGWLVSLWPLKLVAFSWAMPMKTTPCSAVQRALLGGDGVLLLAAAEMDDRDIVLLGEGVDGASEPFEQRSEQGWRSNGCVQLLTAERGDVAGRLEQGARSR
jgi:hypothetical protein